MSAIGKVGPWEIKWKTIPTGPAGKAIAELKDTRLGEDAKPCEVAFHWRRDKDGLWLELPQGVFGYDLESELNDEGRPVFQVTERYSAQFWQGLSYLHAGEDQAIAGGQSLKKGIRVRAQMPGKILRISVKAGDSVEKGQALLVMEAMKMENEIRASHSGKIAALKVSEGQAVETGADLCLIDP